MFILGEMQTLVELSRQAIKDFRKAPGYIRNKLISWTQSVETIGLEATRRIPGYHDEPLQGQRVGQRSIRLNQQWRAIYSVTDDAPTLQILTVQEVTPHDY